MKSDFNFYSEKMYNGIPHKVAVSGIINETLGSISIGMAICSLKDRFSRKVGRGIAATRANTAPLSTIPLTETPGKSFVAFAKELCNIPEEGHISFIPSNLPGLTFTQDALKLVG